MTDGPVIRKKFTVDRPALSSYDAPPLAGPPTLALVF